MHCGVAVLGAMLLLRHSDRLLLAPLYGAGLLLVAELGVRSIELRGVSLVDARSIGTRLGVVSRRSGGCLRRGVRRDRGDGRSGPVALAHGGRSNRGGAVCGAIAFGPAAPPGMTHRVLPA